LKYRTHINGIPYDYREWQNPNIDELFVETARKFVKQYIELYSGKIVSYELISSKSGAYRVEARVDKIKELNRIKNSQKLFKLNF